MDYGPEAQKCDDGRYLKMRNDRTRFEVEIYITNIKRILGGLWTLEMMISLRPHIQSAR